MRQLRLTPRLGRRIGRPDLALTWWKSFLPQSAQLRPESAFVCAAVASSADGRRSGGGRASPTTDAHLEDFDERVAEVPAHRAVQHEIDGAVDERHDVPQVAERNVEPAEDRRVDAAPECEHALRQLGRDEAQGNGDEHRRRPGVLGPPRRLRVRRRRPLDDAAPALGVADGADELNADDRQYYARTDLQGGKDQTETN